MIKICKWCGVEKDISKFYRYKKTGKLYSHCKKCNIEKSNRWSKENKDKANALGRKWVSNNRDKRNGLQRIYNKKYRLEFKLIVMKHYGDSKCECCGESNIGFLTIDHINNDGKKHRDELKKRGDSFYSWLIKQKFPKGFRVLCFNCNLGRAITNDKICPHSKNFEDMSGYLPDEAS